MKTLKATVSLFLAAFTLSLVRPAGAVPVRDTVNDGDARWFTTGCKFENTVTNGAISIGAWVKSVSQHKENVNIFGNIHVNANYKCGGIMLSITGATGSGVFCFEVEGANETGNLARKRLTASGTTPLLNDGQWHFLLGTCDIAAGIAQLYIDGQLAVEDTSLGFSSLPSGRSFACCKVGKTDESTTLAAEGYGAAFLGRFAEYTLWNKVLTADEVADLYTRRAQPWDEGLVGYWPLAGDAKDYAAVPETRADGTVPDALFYYEQKAEDSAFFPACPTTGRFVISPTQAKAIGYAPATDCDFAAFSRPATNIQDAVDAASKNETVYIFSGYYPISTPVTLKTKSVNLQSINPVTFQPDRDGVVIDGQGLCRTLHIERKGNYRNIVDSLTLTNGTSCVYMYDGDLKWSATTYTMELRNCRVVGNRVASGVSGVRVGKQGLVSNCVFEANHSDDNVLLSWTTDFGTASTLPVSRRNVFKDCLVIGNTSGSAKKSLLGDGANVAYFEGCVFSNNCFTTQGDSKGNVEGALVNLNGDGYVRDCLFADNCKTGARANCVVNLYGKYSMMSNCVVRGNTTSGYGVRSLENQTDSRVFESEIRDISTALVGGLYARNVLAVGNGSGIGFQVHAFEGVTSRCENCTFANFNRGIYVSGGDKTTTLSLVNVISAAKTVDLMMNVALGGVAITNSCLAKMSSDAGALPAGIPTENIVNRWVNEPGFTDAAQGDYTLRRGAFARDKGVTLDWMDGASLDLARKPRRVNRDGVAYAENALSDLGCFENQEATRGFYLFVR